jgi:alkanesulfonate monooxygenase SsuD/methylene tetrahydromethanopterin reductase-like flavin-dependent oxidoreductase (luciferase family)
VSESELIHLAADISFAHTDFLWRTPGSWEGYGYYGNPAMYEDIARIASRGVMDLLFFGDAAETPEIHGGDHHAAVRLGVRWPKHDMFPMAPIMARAAPGVGIGLTMSTTYHHPFHVARLYNALDHVTGDLRYERAQEHLKVVTGLWDTVEKDAIVMDREKGYFADPGKVHLLNHKGRFYDVRGPLPVLPSPQGRPPIIQAGQSGPGMELAATYADMQFVWRRTLPSMKEHRAKLDAMLLARGRKPRDVGMLWLMRIQAAESVSEAVAMERRFLDSLPPDAGLMLLSTTYGLDFSIFEGGMKLSEAAESVKSQNTHWGLFEDVLKTNDPDMSIEEFGRRYMSEGMPSIVGTPKMIVDEMERIHHETGANGGFILANGFSTPGNIREFVDLVVPELQRRGLSKKKYAGPTLRDNLLI